MGEHYGERERKSEAESTGRKRRLPSMFRFEDCVTIRRYDAEYGNVRASDTFCWRDHSSVFHVQLARCAEKEITGFSRGRSEICTYRTMRLATVPRRFGLE